MSNVLCLDFGTSSIRAVVRDNRGRQKVLPIAEISSTQSIDGASIPSAFCIDTDFTNIYFGQSALDQIAINQYLEFATTSPKSWLSEIITIDIDTPVTDGTTISRRDVLTGLIALALHASVRTGDWGPPENPQEERNIRIAHPVWVVDVRAKADQILGEILAAAIPMATEGNWSKTTAEVLQSWTAVDDSASRPCIRPSVDTIEPIAAAVELLPHISNTRKLCMVVDVGAGTTDLGIFQLVIPDRQVLNIREESKLIPVGSAYSVFFAGDKIDQIVLDLLCQKNKTVFNENRTQIESQIRFQKENLFINHGILVNGIRLDLNEVVRSREMKKLITEIRRGVESQIKKSFPAIRRFTSTPGIGTEILVVMAGGGAQIDCLVQTLLEPFSNEGIRFTFKQVKPDAPRNMAMHGAGYERLAVGLGGASDEYEHIVHEHAKLQSVPGLGAPKQLL